MQFPSFAVSAFLCLAAISNEEAYAFAPNSGVAHRSASSSGVMGNSRIAPTGRESRTSLFMSSRQQTGRDFYRILGLQRNADIKEIKAAFRGKAKQFHPGACDCIALRLIALRCVSPKCCVCVNLGSLARGVAKRELGLLYLFISDLLHCIILTYCC